jgi:hypothetical protein
MSSVESGHSSDQSAGDPIILLSRHGASKSRRPTQYAATGWTIHLTFAIFDQGFLHEHFFPG